MANTYVISIRVDIRDVATLAAFLVKNNIRVVSKSFPIVEGFKFAAETIRNNHPSLSFTIIQAVEFLNSLGLETHKGRGAKALLKELQYVELKDMLGQIITPRNVECDPIISEESNKEIEERRKKSDEEMLESFINTAGLDIE